MKGIGLGFRWASGVLETQWSTLTLYLAVLVRAVHCTLSASDPPSSACSDASATEHPAPSATPSSIPEDRSAPRHPSVLEWTTRRYQSRDKEPRDGLGDTWPGGAPDDVTLSDACVLSRNPWDPGRPWFCVFDDVFWNASGEWTWGIRRAARSRRRRRWWWWPGESKGFKDSGFRRLTFTPTAITNSKMDIVSCSLKMSWNFRILEARRIVFLPHSTTRPRIL